MDTLPEAFNWPAFATGVIAAFLFGWLIYSPRVFGKKWAEGSGVELGQTSEMPVFAMLTQIVALVLLAAVVGVTAMISALWTVILAILAAAAFVVSSGAFVRKSRYALYVDGGYVICAGVIMILAQGAL